MSRPEAERALTVSALVFDLDGTLIDSRRDLATAINRMRRDLGLDALTLESIVGMVGEGARELVRRALAGFGEPDFEDAFGRFRDYYWESCLEHTRPYHGISELVAASAERWPLAVLTNKPEAVSRRILDGLGFAPFLRAVVGGDTFSARKPDPVGLHHLGNVLGVELESLWLIGDSRIDAAAARAAGCRFAFVEWGFAGEAERREIVPDLRAATPGELRVRLGLQGGL